MRLFTRYLIDIFIGLRKEPLAYKSISGLENIDKVIAVNQSPIGRTPRSNPATYTGVFSEIRKLLQTFLNQKLEAISQVGFLLM